MAPSQLSRAIAAGQWPLAIQSVTKYPERKACKRSGLFDGRTDSKLYPLHEALIAQASLACVQALLEAAPSIVQQPESSFQRLPLHCACRKKASGAVIALLIQEYPLACQHMDSLQRLPLHYALTNGADLPVLNLLLHVGGPHAVRGRDYEGWTPVHVAIRYGKPPSIVRALLQAFPQSVLISTHKGNRMSNLVPPTSPHREEILQLIEQTTAYLSPELRNNALPRPGRMIDEAPTPTTSYCAPDVGDDPPPLHIGDFPQSLQSQEQQQQ